MMKKRTHIHFTGTVQGVGFRYTTVNTANRLGLVGWVKNMSDGSVEAVVEGDEETIKNLIDSLNRKFDGYISDIEIKWSAATNEFALFDVRS
jgi:acylphosphatase